MIKNYRQVYRLFSHFFDTNLAISADIGKKQRF